MCYFPQVLDRLRLCAHRCQYTPQQPLSEMRRILRSLEEQFGKLADLRVAGEARVLVAELEQRDPDPAALHALILLGNEGSASLCSLLAREGAVRAALGLCLAEEEQEPQSQGRREIRILALRALSSVCCVAECIRELEKVIIP